MQDYVVAHEALSLLGTRLPTAREAAAASAAAAAASEGQALALPAHAQVAPKTLTQLIIPSK